MPFNPRKTAFRLPPSRKAYQPRTTTEDGENRPPAKAKMSEHGHDPTTESDSVGQASDSNVEPMENPEEVPQSIEPEIPDDSSNHAPTFAKSRTSPESGDAVSQPLSDSGSGDTQTTSREVATNDRESPGCPPGFPGTFSCREFTAKEPTANRQRNVNSSPTC